MRRDPFQPYRPGKSKGKSTNGHGRKIGLARALSKMGLCSRSKAAELIHAGRVRLNGAVKRNPETPVSEGRDRIELDGRAVVTAAKVYLLLNKPRGAVTTASDEHGRETVYDVLQTAQALSPAKPQDIALAPFSATGATWLAPVGRLDKASEGLLLLTNDSEWAARVLAPKTHLDKTYHVQIAAVANALGSHSVETGNDLLAALRKGVASEGEVLRVRRVGILRTGDKNSWLEIVLDEGKNRQIRRMLDALGVEVLRLVRVAIGPLALGTLAKGASRELTPTEKASLDHAMRNKH